MCSSVSHWTFQIFKRCAETEQDKVQRHGDDASLEENLEHNEHKQHFKQSQSQHMTNAIKVRWHKGKQVVHISFHYKYVV